MPQHPARLGKNCHDAELLVATLEGLVVARPAWEEDEQQHMCLDAAYDSEPVREELKERGYVPHIRPADKKAREREGSVHRHGGRARRWVVERTHSWLNRSRRLLVRWEKKPRTT
jgi:putative transposase